MLHNSDEEVPDRWDDEFNEEPKIYRYERSMLISLQNSPLCQHKPTFFMEVEIILDAPHVPTIPLDHTKSINLTLSNRITNRAQHHFANFQRKNFEQWWSRKQEEEQIIQQQEKTGQLKEHSVKDELGGSIHEKDKENVPIKKEEEKVLQGNIVGSNDEIYAFEKIIYNCVESVLENSDAEDDTNDIDVPQPEEKRPEENSENEVTFDYPSRNLSINMAIICRRRMSSIMRCGSSRMKRTSPPCHPCHPTMEWKTVESTPSHLLFDDLVSSCETKKNKISPSGRHLPFGSRRLVPDGTCLISVSKDLISDTDAGLEKNKNDFFEEENCLNENLKNAIANDEFCMQASVESQVGINVEDISSNVLSPISDDNLKSQYCTKKVPNSNISIIPKEKIPSIHDNINYHQVDSISQNHEPAICKIEENNNDCYLQKSVSCEKNDSVSSKEEEETVCKEPEEISICSEESVINQSCSLSEEKETPEVLNSEESICENNSLKGIRLTHPQSDLFENEKHDSSCVQSNDENLLAFDGKLEMKDVSSCQTKSLDSGVSLDNDKVITSGMKLEDSIPNPADFVCTGYVGVSVCVEELDCVDDSLKHSVVNHTMFDKKDSFNTEMGKSDLSNKSPRFVATINHNVDTLDGFDDDLENFSSIKQIEKCPDVLSNDKSVKADLKQKSSRSKTFKNSGSESNKKRKNQSKSPMKCDQQNKLKPMFSKTDSDTDRQKDKTLKGDVRETSKNVPSKNQKQDDSITNQESLNKNQEEPPDIIVRDGYNIMSLGYSYTCYDENESHEEWKCQRKSRRKRISSKDTLHQIHNVKDISDKNRSKSECASQSSGEDHLKNFAGWTSKGADEQQRYTPRERARSRSLENPHLNSNLPITHGTWKEPDVHAFSSKNYVMYILRGIPGSGKTTIANEIKKYHSEGDVHICSVRKVRYINHGDRHCKQDPSELIIHQTACQEEAQTQCNLGRNVVIIDDTNLKHEDFRFYLQLAHYNDYIVNFIEPDLHVDIDTCFTRNKQTVPIDKLISMKSTYQELIAYYYGWCISLLDTLDLRGAACQVIQSHSSDIPAFKKFLFKQNIQKIENLFHVYHMKSSSSSKNMLHVTCCYTNSGRRPGSKNYARTKEVLNCLGHVEDLQIIGLCITPKSLFARVLLSEKQKLVWGNNDSRNGEINQLHKECHLDDNVISEHFIGKDSDGEDCHSKLSPARLNEHVNKISNFIMNMDENYLLPDFGIGSTAHLTLGVVDGFGPVTSRDNLRSIITSEMNEKPKTQYAFSKEMMRCYGDNLWVIYFKESIVIPAMFCGTYYAERLS